MKPSKYSARIPAKLKLIDAQREAIEDRADGGWKGAGKAAFSDESSKVDMHVLIQDIAHFHRKFPSIPATHVLYGLGQHKQTIGCPENISLDDFAIQQIEKDRIHLDKAIPTAGEATAPVAKSRL